MRPAPRRREGRPRMIPPRLFSAAAPAKRPQRPRCEDAHAGRKTRTAPCFAALSPPLLPGCPAGRAGPADHAVPAGGRRPPPRRQLYGATVHRRHCRRRAEGAQRARCGRAARGAREAHGAAGGARRACAAHRERAVASSQRQRPLGGRRVPFGALRRRLLLSAAGCSCGLLRARVPAYPHCCSRPPPCCLPPRCRSSTVCHSSVSRCRRRGPLPPASARHAAAGSFSSCSPSSSLAALRPSAPTWTRAAR